MIEFEYVDKYKSKNTTTIYQCDGADLMETSRRYIQLLAPLSA